MINIKYTYSTNTCVLFDNDFRMPLSGTMDDIAVCVMTEMCKHNFTHADVCSEETGEVLMVIERS